jgi:Predicted oxidoreductases (related to aryl-alcohol dehydrogenases)
MIRRVALGTVQFGLSYGIANQSGQISRDEASAILQEAWASGIRMLDTAIVYGESEQVLGEIGIPSWDVVSKLPEIPLDCSNVMEWVFDSINGSLDRLKIDCLYGLLLHRPEQLLLPFGEEAP